MIGTKFVKGRFDNNDYVSCAEWCNKNNATIVDKGDYFECVEVDNTQSRIDEYKRNLEETDYVVIKIAEGVATADEYADVLRQRQEWRNAINDLQE